MRKLVLITVLALALALIVTLAPACGGGGEEPTPPPGTTPTPKATPTSTPQAKVLKMGALCSLSGPAAQWGTQILWGIEWAVDKYNETGFKVGKDTYTIKLVTGDDKFLGSSAAQEITRLISSESIHYVSGPIATFDAIAPIAEQGKCFVFNMTNDQSFVGTDRPYSFIGAPPITTWNATFWDQAYADPDMAAVKTAAILTPDPNLYDKQVAADKAALESHGSEVVIIQRYTAFAQDYYPILTPVVAKHPDLVSLNAGNIGDQSLMVKQLRELGYKGIIGGPSHGDPESAIPFAGCAASEGFRTNDPDYSSNLYPESVRSLYAEFQTLHPGQALPLTTYLGYGSVQLYVQAIQAAGSTDPDQVMKVFDDPNFKFEYFGSSGVTLGGAQTWGNRRVINDEVCYSKIINCKKVMTSRKPAVTP